MVAMPLKAAVIQTFISKLESLANTCVGNAYGPSERSGTSYGTGKDLVFNTESILLIDEYKC